MDAATNTARSRRALLAALTGAVLSSAACAPPVALPREDVPRLRDAKGITVDYDASPTPYVACWALFADDEYACQVEDQITARVRSSFPIDPARATAERFVAFVRSVRTGLRFQDVPPGRGAQPERSEGSGIMPVLTFEALHWSLVGGHYSYRPSFAIRATLVERPGGRVLWRSTCREDAPQGRGASPAELSAHGGALYARMIAGQADRCAKELLDAFRPTPAPGAQATGGGTPQVVSGS